MTQFIGVAYRQQILSTSTTIYQQNIMFILRAQSGKHQWLTQGKHTHEALWSKVLKIDTEFWGFIHWHMLGCSFLKMCHDLR